MLDQCRRRSSAFKSFCGLQRMHHPHLIPGAARATLKALLEQLLVAQGKSPRCAVSTSEMNTTSAHRPGTAPHFAQQAVLLAKVREMCLRSSCRSPAPAPSPTSETTPKLAGCPRYSSDLGCSIAAVSSEATQEPPAG